ncbi:MEKHLA domain-containing protein [Paenibacillus sp. A3]|uniref:MEKHLA domain-containing protein n=1 Tax=Paenibacillus sp. A3 TaxID=1337054 RepID=UPI0006D5681E|nr:MEKHLA domain-containing protein [Paenibacillus sp. A3]KPV57680.1 MEKHLA domain-containing protein [Paenibacillus sp. A3]
MILPNGGVGVGSDHVERLVRSYRRLTGNELLPGPENSGSLAERLFLSPIVVLSHGTETDPVLNYGNQAALHLWEMDWETFTRTPSRYTAEEMERTQREQLLKKVQEQGYADDYTGIRISRSGRRFYIKKATVWNITDEDGRYTGQAACFTEFEYC